MTEDEAKKKVCPLAWVNSRDRMCFASACMMWHDDGYCGLVVKFPILNERRVT